MKKTIKGLYKIVDNKCRGYEEKNVILMSKLKENILLNCVELGTKIPSYLVGVDSTIWKDKIISILVYTQDGRLKKIRGVRYIDFFDNGVEYAWNFKLDGEACSLCEEDYERYSLLYDDYKKRIKSIEDYAVVRKERGKDIQRKRGWKNTVNI